MTVVSPQIHQKLKILSPESGGVKKKKTNSAFKPQPSANSYGLGLCQDRFSDLIL